MTEESYTLHRVESKIVDILDNKRGSETRSSYLRRSIEAVLYGAPRSTPTHVVGHRMSRKSGTPWTQLRVSLAKNTHRDMMRRLRKSGQSIVDFLRQTIMESTLVASFEDTPEVVALTLAVPAELARKVDAAEVLAYIRRKWGDSDTASR